MFLCVQIIYGIIDGAIYSSTFLEKYNWRIKEYELKEGYITKNRKLPFSDERILIISEVGSYINYNLYI